MKDFICNVVGVTKKYIEKFEGYSDLSSTQKKARVDETVKNYIEATIDTIGLNFIARFVIKKILIDNIPTITQAIFDLIATKVKGITK